MDWNDDIEKAINAGCSNPFTLETPYRQEVAQILSNLPVPEMLSKCIRGGKRGVEQAKRLILALGHCRAQAYPTEPKKVLDCATVPTELQAQMPRSLGEYLRVVMAAGRCFQALTKICGTSTRMLHTRRDTWAACFGDSLRHALELERVIRDHDILLLGETGTGKEAFAQAIQTASPGDTDGKPAPSSAINAAAIPDTLVESELFGHVKGAFTGATDTRIGRLRSATGGCFFLDEVGDLPFTTQVKLLRIIETNEVHPLGTDKAYKVDVRYVAATHKNLQNMVENNKFRRDLYQRLAGNIIRIPPLRDRPEDIVDIGMSFARNYLADADQLDRIDSWLRSHQACTYAWPGNVRELQNVLRDLMLGLPPRLAGSSLGAPLFPTGNVPMRICNGQSTLQEVTDWYLVKVLADTEDNYTKAADILGLDRSTVRRRIKLMRGR